MSLGNVSGREPGNVSILLVEDNPVDAAFVMGMLRNEAQCGSCRHVTDLTGALAELSATEVDVVLLDLNLGDSSGYETFDRIRRSSAQAAILVLSGSDDEELASRTVREGGQDYLVKGSFDRKLLLRAIRYAVERKTSEEALRKSEATARAIFENSLDAIVMFDDRGALVEVNPAAAALFGLPRPDLVGKSLREAGGEGFEAEVARMRRESSSSGRGKFILICADRKRHVVDYCFKANVLPGRHLGVMRDITEQQSLEDQLRQSQKMEAVGRLAGNVAHDFNNILSIITGYAELIELHAQDDRLRSKASRILSATLKASSLTKQLLAFGRKQVVKPALLNLANVVSELSSMITCLAGAETQIAVLTSKMAGLVYADQGQMEQVLLNLVTNAHEAMPYGGMLTIVIERFEVRDGSPELPAGIYVRLSVQDTGSGISPDVKVHIFDPFFTTKPAGSGLGLSTVLGIVKQAAGYITVDSVPQKGSIFTIYLPVAAEVTETEEPHLEPQARESAGEETILLVDDEEELGNTATEYLERCGYRVLKARAVDEAMQIARKFDDKISLLITDVVMPGGSGRGLVEHMRQERPETGILVISGYADDAVRQHGFEEPTAFLQKPFTLQSLSVKIRALLDDTKSRVGS